LQDAGQDAKFREVYDVAVARAVAEMRVLAELCLPLVRVGGIFVAAKGPNPQEEVEAAKAAVELLGASKVSLCAVDSEGPLGQRTAVVCLKDHATPAKYPRRAGMPNKRPL
jgi:16S rRNA (guanine527-N7)-methyltransferase